MNWLQGYNFVPVPPFEMRGRYLPLFEASEVMAPAWCPSLLPVEPTILIYSWSATRFSCVDCSTDRDSGMIPSSKSPGAIAFILVRTLGRLTLDASGLSFNSEYWPTYKCGKVSEWSPRGCDLLFRAKDLGLDTSFVFEAPRREAMRSRSETRYLDWAI